MVVDERTMFFVLIVYLPALFYFSLPFLASFVFNNSLYGKEKMK